MGQSQQRPILQVTPGTSMTSKFCSIMCSFCSSKGMPGKGYVGGVRFGGAPQAAQQKSAVSSHIMKQRSWQIQRFPKQTWQADGAGSTCSLDARVKAGAALLHGTTHQGLARLSMRITSTQAAPGRGKCFERCMCKSSSCMPLFFSFAPERPVVRHKVWGTW